MYYQHVFALDLLFRVFRGCGRERRALHGFVQLCQFLYKCNLTVTECLKQILQGARKAVRRFIKHHGARL